MRYAKWVLLGIAVTFFLGTSPVLVHAIDTIPTPDAYWLKDTHLKIAAYSRIADGTDLKYLQLFNDSDGLLDVKDWKISGVFSDGTRSELPLLVGSTGRMKPNSHAVVQVVDEVGNSSFDSGTWFPFPAPGVLLTSLEISSRSNGWKTDVYLLKSSTIAVVDPVTGKSTSVTQYADFWVRAQISGESYTSTLSSFSASTSERPLDDGLYVTPDIFTGKIAEVYPYSSDCAPNDLSVLCGDYIKIHLNDTKADLSSFVLRTDSSSSSRTSSNTFHLDSLAYSLSDDGYLTIAQDETGKRLSLTNSGGYLWVEDLYGSKLYAETMTKYESAGSSKQGLSWAVDSDGWWQWSTTPEPYGPNRVTAPVVATTTCPDGKYLNPDTGRCRTIEEAVNALALCSEGQERNPLTNRCRAKVLAVSAVLTPCGEGQERNPVTNRCRSIALAVAELLPCDEGYERNPATNRCRKVVADVEGIATKTAPLVGQVSNTNWDMWTWGLAVVGATGAVGYGIYEWRHELLGFGQKVAGRFGKK